MDWRKAKVGMFVEKTKGDYRFRGWIQSTFRKRSGLNRVVVENPDGILHIFNPEQLEELSTLESHSTKEKLP